MILQLGVALFVRQIAGEKFGSGWCPSDDYEDPIPNRDCYFPSTPSDTTRIATMFCDTNNGGHDNSITLFYKFDEPNKYCPSQFDQNGERCTSCLDWELGIGCAKMGGPNMKYKKFIDEVPTEFVTKWNGGPVIDDEGWMHNIYSNDWEPVRMWVGCEYQDDDIKAVELFFQAPNPTEILEQKFLPPDFLKDVSEHMDLEKLTVQANLAGLREEDIPGRLRLKELDISNNDFQQTGWPWEMFGSNEWEQLKMLDMSHNDLGDYPTKLMDGGNVHSPWHHATGLQKLDLSYNKITMVTPCTFGCVLEEYSWVITNKQLKFLDLSNNELGEYAFTTVKTINRVGTNKEPYQLKAAEVFKNLSKLRTINLSNNKLTYLPPNLFTVERLNKLESIDLRGNAMECLPNLPKGNTWTADGPFFFDGATDLEICEQYQPKYLSEERSILDAVVDNKYWVAVPMVGVVGAAIALALNKQKAEAYETMA